MSLLFLIQDTKQIADGNCLRLVNAALQQNVPVAIADIDTLSLHKHHIKVRGFSVIDPLKSGLRQDFSKSFYLSDFETTWVLSLGKRENFLDKIQLLEMAEKTTRLVNSTDSILFLKSKYSLAGYPDRFNYPESHASSNARELLQIVESGGNWIAKPPAGSFGRKVFFLNKHTANRQAILDLLCGSQKDQYTLLQRYVAEISQGEKRVLLANGNIIGQYLRTATIDHRTNLMQGGTPSCCSLTTREFNYCMDIGKYLKSRGALFAGIDLVFPYIIEINVISPGGLATLETLGGPDQAGNVIKNIIE
jgi:glutathione synthase